MESTTNRINIVIYAENEQQSIDIIEAILTTRVSETDIWNEKIKGCDVYGYIRSPGATPTASPIGITDILIVQASRDSNQWAPIKSYIDARKGIPFKFITSKDDLSEEAKNLDCEFLNFNEIKSKNIKEKFINSAINLEETLRNVFNEIDVDKNGSIDAGEIINISHQLGHPLNDEDAKEISKSISKDGKIGYDSFKQWWILRNADFNSFRKLVEIELVVNNFIKKSKETFNAYLDNIQMHGEKAKSQQTSFLSVFNITPEIDFESGTALGLHLTLGSEFDTFASSFPNYLKETPFSLGLEFRLNNANDGVKMVELLEGIKEMAMQMEPNVKRFFDTGVMINFRHVGTAVFLDISYGGMAGDKINGILSTFNPSSINISGNSDFDLCTKLSPVDLLDKSYEQLIELDSFLKIEGKGEYSQLKTLFNFIINTITSINHGKIPDRLKLVVYMLRLASVVKKVDFNFNYDVATLKDFIVDAHSNFGFKGLFQSNTESWNTKYQPMVNSMIDQFSGMAQIFLAQFMEGILAIDLDNISLYTTIPIIKFYLKLNILFKGLADLIAKVFQQ
jgi:flagellin-specific chaperone FliS